MIEKNDELSFVLETYGSEIEKFLEADDFDISFFGGSEDFVDKIEPMKESGKLLYRKSPDNYNSYNVVVYQDFSIEKTMLTDINKCYLDNKKFIKIITPFTRERSYDFLISKRGEMEEILKELSIRSENANFHSFNNPVIGLNFDEIKKETIDFLMNEEFRDFCRKKRIPLKRGLVLEGVPGTGKTLTLRYLKEQALKNKIAFTSFSTPQEFLENSDRYFSNEKKIFIFEDFDAIVADRDNTGGQPNALLTKVLNVLEGVNEIQDVVTIFTTNKIALFDKAFLRPGRIDKIISYQSPTERNIIEFFEVYIEDHKEYFEEFKNYLKSLSADISYAILKGICDDINIWVFNNRQISFDEMKKIAFEKIKGANQMKSVKEMKSYIL